MTVDLNNADLDELDALLAAAPAACEPMDAVMLDGFLAGVSVQPRIVPVTRWLAFVFDPEGRALPADHDPAWLARCRALIERRFEVMNTDLADTGWFDPVIVDIDQAPPLSEYETPRSPAARTLAPWLDGFDRALSAFDGFAPGAVDEAALLAGARVQALRTQDRGDDVKAAVDELVAAVAALWGATEAGRYHVETVRRELPKVGRNDPCPCGSGRKFKLCHGASA